MKDPSSTNLELIEEISFLKQRIKELEQSESERKRAEEDLQESESKLRTLFESANEAIFVAQDGKLVFLNPMTTVMIGYTREELMARSFVEFIYPDDRDMVLDRHVRRMKGEEIPYIYSFRIIHRDGNIRWVDLNTVLISWKGKAATLNFMSNITERKRAEEALKESEEKFHVLAESTPIAIMLYQNNKWVYANPAAEKISGYSLKELLTMDFWASVHPDYRHLIQERGQKRQEGEAVVNRYELKIISKNGTEKWVDLSSASTILGGSPAGIISVRDITEQKKVEEALKESEIRYRSIFENVVEGIFQTTPEGRFLMANPVLAQIYGYSSPEEIIETVTDIGWQIYVNPDERDEFLRIVKEKGVATGFESQMRRKDGSIFWASLNARAVYDENGKLLYHEGTLENITSRKLAEEELTFTNLVLSTQQEVAIDGILVVDENGKILSFNKKFTDMWGIPSEVIETRRDELVLQFVIGKLREPQEFLEKVNYLYEHKQETSRDEVVLRDGRTFDRYSAPMFGSDTRYYGRVWYFRDITSRKLAEEELKQALEKLRKTLAGTIQAISLTVETRDPYTAGHQKRVSNLARVIAQEMGLSTDTVENIRIAGVLHDIGKTSVPAEILSKPGKLTNIEMSLIQVHPQSGYDILKEAELPCLIAQIVLQHHEHMNGSGYPKGLKGDQIVLGARILAVADVVEAIASHRPYRPSRGIDVALGEIEKNKGILYDAEVADVCLRLFREKGFRFE